jgi:hypothetical protein
MADEQATSNKQAHSSAKENGNHPAPTRPIPYSAKIGFFAGVIFGLVRWLATGLNFTEVTQAFLADPFVPRQWLSGFYWQLTGWVLFILMSVLAGVLYYVVLGRFKGPWPGLWMGVVWWGVFYAWLGPIVGAVPLLKEIGWSSLVTDFCLFIVWGLFIGYSIAFEMHDEVGREPMSKQKGQKGGAPQPSA